MIVEIKTDKEGRITAVARSYSGYSKERPAFTADTKDAVDTGAGEHRRHIIPWKVIEDAVADSIVGHTLDEVAHLIAQCFPLIGSVLVSDKARLTPAKIAWALNTILNAANNCVCNLWPGDGTANISKGSAMAHSASAAAAYGRFASAVAVSTSAHNTAAVANIGHNAAGKPATHSARLAKKTFDNNAFDPPPVGAPLAAQYLGKLRGIYDALSRTTPAAFSAASTAAAAAAAAAPAAAAVRNPLTVLKALAALCTLDVAFAKECPGGWAGFL